MKFVSLTPSPSHSPSPSSVSKSVSARTLFMSTCIISIIIIFLLAVGTHGADTNDANVDGVASSGSDRAFHSLLVKECEIGMGSYTRQMHMMMFAASQVKDPALKEYYDQQIDALRYEREQRMFHPLCGGGGGGGG